MKENLKNTISLTVLIIMLFAVYILLYKEKIEGQIFAVIFASIVTAYYAFLKQKIENDRMFKDLFDSFNDKYNGTTNDIFNELRRNPEKKIEDICKNGENIVIDYFNLCAEEYLWYSKGRIPEKVWKAWKFGINQNLKLEQVKVIYKKEIDNSEESFYGLVKELNIQFPF